MDRPPSKRVNTNRRSTSIISLYLLAFILFAGAAIFLYTLFQPLTGKPILLPPPLISRSHAEFLANNGGGRFAFQKPVTITSYISSYSASLHALGIVEQTKEANTPVWVVQVEGLSRFFSPIPETSQQPLRRTTYILIIGITGHPYREMAK